MCTAVNVPLLMYLYRLEFYYTDETLAAMASTIPVYYNRRDYLSNISTRDTCICAQGQDTHVYAADVLI